MQGDKVSSRTQATKISTNTYNAVFERDKGCVLCNSTGTHKQLLKSGINVLECHHYISRGRLGMGIPENLVMLCKYHHLEETKYRDAIKDYLKSHYENWNEENLKYRKGIK